MAVPDLQDREWTLSEKPRNPRPGIEVCDCWYQHQQVVDVWPDGDTVRLSNGLVCSYNKCCDTAHHGRRLDHPQADPDPDDLVSTCLHI